VHLAGNIQGRSTLALLKFIKPGDLVVLELDSWCLHGMGDIHKSPNVSVFTNLMPDHLNFYLKNSKDEGEAMEKYFTDKAQIYLNQNKEDFLICGEKISKRIGKTKSQPSQIKNKFDGPRKIIAKKVDVPKNWKLKIKGDHNLENIACAVKACEALNISAKAIKKGVENFTGVEGRLEFVKDYKGIKIYNDTTATTPDATIMALRALSDKKSKIVLICGGADKGLDMPGLVKEIPKYSKSVILLSGSGSLKLKQDFPKQTKEMPLVDNLKEAVLQGIKLCQKGDTLLFSPAFASFGMFKNEYDRGGKFMALIKALK
jgi:UDP-N-acetylmuramoylalanine--D-glutamate ligase